MAGKKKPNTEDSTLYEQANGNPVQGYLLLKSKGGNVPPAWVERYTKSRRSKQAGVAKALKGGLKGYAALLEWEDMYKKECFYYGIRALFELERDGKTAY
jgi:hypothetical protein